MVTGVQVFITFLLKVLIVLSLELVMLGLRLKLQAVLAAMPLERSLTDVPITS